MVNTDDFLKRLEVILDYYSLSASVFADKVGVQRSGLSHLLSGRNKPSLDFIMKITENFPDVDLYWLLNGTGTFPKETGGPAIASPAPSAPAQPISPATPGPDNEKREAAVTDLFSQAEIPLPLSAVAPESEQEIKAAEKRPEREKKIERVLLFYSDGTFKEYTPEN